MGKPYEKKSKRNTAVKKLEDANRRNVTFSKRRTGLFNKLTELSILCQAETALIIASPSDKKLYACGYPSADAVIRRFLTRGPPVVAAGNMNHDQEKLETLRAKYDGVQEQLKEEKEEKEKEKEEQKRNPQVFPFWWESPIDDMDLDGIQQFKKSLERCMLNLITTQQVMMMQNNCHGSNSIDNSTVPPFPPQPPVPPPDNCHEGWQQLVENDGNYYTPEFESGSVMLPPFPPQPDNCHGGWQQVENGNGYSQFESGSTSSDHNTSVTLPPFPPSFDCTGSVMLTPPGGFGQFY